ncbi:preprotein translocase subunit SecG [Clostridium sp. ZS2-4]|uniref:preprotein translocase subunit SecG n=1 Tax=Clostridium sp. ZS2-4 TaxID=2987703 RepID=UPI00227D45F1|nr:preprotein translocase subunit SecG [Clostridium sp. ZS2-4]MCY6356853.1 preprotein translocase subunit SecG [Clostridium sp. ZS2-4]
MHTFLVAAQIIISLILIITILKQPGKSDGFNLVSSGAETFFSKNKTKTYEAVLAKTTVIMAVLFAAITIALTLMK